MSGEDSENLINRKIVVVGPVGSGKSSGTGYITGVYDLGGSSKLSGHSVTKEVGLRKGRFIRVTDSSRGIDCKIQFSVVDTEGYGADAYSRDGLRNQLLEALRFETELDAVIIVASFERFRTGLKEDLSHLVGVINTIGISNDNLIVCLTHCEAYNDAVRARYRDEFKAYYGLNISDDRVLFCCFANIDEINDTYKPLVVESIKQSIQTVRVKIAEIKTSVNAASKIRSTEQP